MEMNPDTGEREIMGSNASQTALTVPEIVAMVLSFVNSRRVLAACARINSLWHDTAIPLLWQGNWSLPASDALARLAQDEDRFRYYIRHVKYLELSYSRGGKSNIWSEALFQPTLWKATKLKSLVIESDSLAAECWNLKQAGFWQPELQLFTGGWDLFESNVGHTADFADNLRLLDLGGCTAPLKALLTAFSRMTRLQELSLYDTQPDSLHSAVLRAILRLPALLVLKFTDVEIMEDLTSYQKPAFSNLRRLYWTHEHPHFSDGLCANLLLRLKSLTDFKLYTANSHQDLECSRNFLHPLSQCAKLEMVDIRMLCCENEPKVTTEALLAIAAGCPLLKHFALTAETIPTESPDPIPSLEPFAEHCTNLEYLAIGFPHDNDDIQVIAHYCHKLKELEIFATWCDIIDMRYWDDRVKFQSLEHFTWDFTGPGPDLESPDEDPSYELVDPQIYAQRIATTLRYCMPKIRSVDVEDITNDGEFLITMELNELIPRKHD